MEIDLIENLHELSNTAKRLKLDKYNISQLIHIHNYYCIDDFIDTESYVFQNDVLNADDRKISLILKNFDKAIETNCGNNIDLEQYSINDRFEISYLTNANVKNVSKLYTIKNQFPEDNDLFKCYWLKYFIKECRQIVENIRTIIVQPDESKVNPNSGLVIPISYEYLNAFCNAISNQDLIFENSFITTYRCDITHYTDYLKNEINQNILNIEHQKREDYLALLVHKIETTPFFNFDKTLTEEYLNKYDVDVNNFPKELNKELYELLNTYPNRIDLTPQKREEASQIQLSFYAYFSKIEAKKMVDFMISKKISNLNSNILDQPSIKKLKSKYNSFTYINNLTGQSNLTALKESLIRRKLIASDTDLKDFRKVFSGEAIDNPIVWTGNISELSYFIKQLHNNLKYVENVKQEIWAVTINCFIKENGEQYNRTKLRTQKVPTTSKNIDSALNTLK